MKKIITASLILLLSLPAFAQFNQYPKVDQGNITGGFGLNWIDGELYYRFHFQPEISFANFGVGLDLNLDINKNGNIRKENFNEFSDYLSIIRYVRYGIKHDPVYIKLGALDYYTLGHGSIMYQYNNSPTYDARKIGLVADIDFGPFGFESIYSNFGEAGVVGIRAYVKPLKMTEARNIPIISNLEVGATYAADFNQNSGVVFSQQLLPTMGPLPSYTLNRDDKGRMQIVGADLGLPIINSSMLNLQLYADYAKIINFGSGVATGIKLDLNGLGLVRASVKLERRFNNDQYIPSYFNSLYEIERYRVDSSNNTFASKATMLENIKNPDNGYFGQLDISVLNLFDITGSYQRLDKTPNSGILHLTTQIAPENAPIVARAGYDKINIRDEKDLFKLDDRSYLYFELGYKPLPYIIVSMLYNWTFTPVRDANDNIIDYQPQKRIEPRVSFVYPFNIGQ